MNILPQLIEVLLRMENTLPEIMNLLASGQAEEAAVRAADTWLDKQQVMQLFHISERSLFNLRKKGTLPAYSIGGKIYFRLQDIERILKS